MTSPSFSVRARVPFAKPRPERTPKPEPKHASRVARMIALAHHLDDLIEGGKVESYIDVARALGLSDSRLTQIADLALLSPRIQEALVLGEVVMSPRKAQKLIKLGMWPEQERGLETMATILGSPDAERLPSGKAVRP